MADDKFIMMNMDDKRSSEIAKILGNKTCKKIIDHLSDTNEASEKDIADALQAPINTVEYNLKKLLEAGLVEKTKNYFWSPKGRKIPMYKLAKKHIVISPKSSPSISSLRTIIPVLVAALVIINLIALPFWFPDQEPTQTDFKNFNSLTELQEFLKQNTISGSGGIFESFAKGGDVMFAGQAMDSASESAQATDYSETNIQVEGVDEADIIKNDGKYIYAVSQNKVYIINAFPPEDMEILATIEFKESDNNYRQVSDIYLNDDKLIILGQEYSQILYKEERCMDVKCDIPQNQESTAKAYIYDISDRENPELEEEISLSGNYINSRMIGKYIYLITSQYAYEDGVYPLLKTDSEINIITPEKIYYTDIEDVGFQYTTIASININNGKTSEKTMLTGYSQNIYVSQDNIYTTYTKNQPWMPFVDETSEETTIIHKISIDKDEIEFEATGEVPGHVLNQFSMDEYDENFRIATTIGQVSRKGSESTNNLYILDEDLEQIGELEGLAPGEKIYSVRFMGEKAYIVTFKKVDPLFVIDLSDPEDPEVLGKLKIPGYSDYLHPYDENHIIGIGKDTEEAEQGDFAWYQGVKMAFFDVTDVNNPIELHKVIIGERGTNSEALYNHKAFLFDREKELLVLPIQNEETEEGTFNGAHVYNLNIENGFQLQGKISHTENEDQEAYWRYGSNIRRSLYMDDTLYTFSDQMIKANDLDDLDEINYVSFL